MKCAQCGIDLPEEALFCAGCGAPVSPKKSLQTVWATVLAEGAAEDAGFEAADDAPEEAVPRVKKKPAFLFRHSYLFFVLSVLLLLLTVPLGGIFAVRSFQTAFFPFALVEFVLAILLSLTVAFSKSRIPGACAYAGFFVFALLMATELYQPVITGSFASFLNTWTSRDLLAYLSAGVEIGLYLAALVLVLLWVFRPSEPVSVVLASVSGGNLVFQGISFGIFLYRILRYAAVYQLPAFSLMTAYYFFWHCITLLLTTLSLIFFVFAYSGSRKQRNVCAEVFDEELFENEEIL